LYFAISSAIFFISKCDSKTCSILLGISFNADITWSYLAFVSHLFCHRNNANKIIQVICAVKAFVEATQISAPALVNNQ
jgi:hypothetical protein